MALFRVNLRLVKMYHNFYLYTPKTKALWKKKHPFRKKYYGTIAKRFSRRLYMDVKNTLSVSQNICALKRTYNVKTHLLEISPLPVLPFLSRIKQIAFVISFYKTSWSSFVPLSIRAISVFAGLLELLIYNIFINDIREPYTNSV